jgi:hypothetical protein
VFLHNENLDSLSWCGCGDILQTLWANETYIKEWWAKLVLDHGKAREAMVSTIILIPWKIGKNHNATVFQNNVSPTVIARINKARAWFLASANFSSNVISGE